MKVLLIGIFHETHCFVPSITPLSDFKVEHGQTILDRRGDGSQIDGFLEVAEAEGWDVTAVCSYNATPSGMVSDEAMEAFWADAIPGAEAAAAQGMDAIYLSLHGAMVSQSLDDVEGELIRRLRAIPAYAEIPIFGVFDLHANLTEAMTSGANALLCYRENPHIDARDTAVRSARLLAKSLKSGQMPHSLRRSVPIIWPPTGTGTADTPMRDLEALARQIEAENPDIWAVNVVAGFSFADMADAGVCFSAVTVGDDAAAKAALDRLAQLAASLREKGIPAEYTPDEALDKAATLGGKGPIILVEPSENIGAGAPGNGTALLRVFVRRGTANAGVIIHDPEAVNTLRELPIGASMTLPIGGRNNPFDAGPLTLEVTLVSRSNGDYDVEDIHSHFVAMSGRHIKMGPCAVVRHKGITILLTSLRSAPNDLGQWRSQGINPEELDVISVKAAVAHRQAYNPIARASFTVATAGSCSSDSHTLPYRKLRRPIFPLDTNA